VSVRRLIILGAAGFVLGLLINAPARLIHYGLPANISLDGLSGTVWNGSAKQLAVNNIAVGELNWRVAPSSLLRGRLGLILNAQLPDGALAGKAAMGLGGTVTLTNLTGSLPVAYLATDFPAGMLDGRVSLVIEQAELMNGWPTRIKGVIALGNLVQNIPKPMALGTFSATFDGENTGDGAVDGVIATRSGPLLVDGELVLNSDRSYSLEASVGPNAETPDDLKSMLPLVGEKLPDGRYLLRFNDKL
jgi:general secretion pathway protein N